MECDFAIGSLKMRSLPSPNLHHFLLFSCSYPKTLPFSTSKFPLQKKKPLLASPSLPPLLSPSFRAKLHVSSATRTAEPRRRDDFGGNRSIPIQEFRPNLREKLLVRSDFNGIRESGNLVNLNVKEWLKRYSGFLRECASMGRLNEGRAMHGKVIKSGFEPDAHLWVSLINFYVKSGRSFSASRVFDEMPERDVVSWNALISGFVSEGNGSDSVGMYCKMRKENINPNEFALATGLKACSLCFDIEFGRQIHGEAVKLGLVFDLFVGSGLVDLYAKCGEIGCAERVFFDLPEKNNVSWNALLTGYAQHSDGKEALTLFSEMTEGETQFSKYILSSVLKVCAKSGSLREGQALHSLIVKSECEMDEFIGCNLVDMYCKCGMTSDGLKVFNSIQDPDVVAWSAIIAGLGQQGLSLEAAELFNRMRCTKVRPNQFTLASIISAASSIGDVLYGASVHACVYKYGFDYDNSVGNALITMYMKNRCVQNGVQVFEEQRVLDLVSWNSLLLGFHDTEDDDTGLRIFYTMLHEGLECNIYTFVSVLRSCSSLMNLSFGKQVHAQIIKNSIYDNDFVGTALMDMYAKCSCLENAEVAFKRLSNGDLFTWTVIISGYSQTDQAEKAIYYLGQMRAEGIMPNEFTLASCLSGCSRMAALETGRQLHSLAVKTGHFVDMFVASAVIDMYGKCGCIEDAQAMFKGLVSRDAVSWNTIINGYSQNGEGHKALETFRIMMNEGIAPDGFTFLGVLSACSYMGSIQEGKDLFDSMIRIYGIEPSIEHYACMVDILGRSGKFNEIMTFIEEMNLTSDSLIWETILGACKLHGNLELGERAAKKLFELQPDIDSSYVLLSNIFAAKGRWDDVRKVRDLMFTQGVKKEPGCSWLEVGGQVHVFTSGGNSHPKMDIILGKLDELTEELSSIGYIPRTEGVLHNVTDNKKVEYLKHHSERLALAFALISTSQVKPVRIFKNLRICEDCHNVMKLVSDRTNRDIVVRDNKCFHHFKGGSCSCHDYW